jgi:HK97 family phage prohead protease
MNPTTKQWFGTVTAGTRSPAGEPEMTISTADRDRQGTHVHPEGARVDHFLRNPVLMYGHDYTSIPIGTVTELEVVPGAGMRMRWRWLEGDEFADRVRNAWDQGIVRAASIGFQPLVAKPNRTGELDYLEWELLEVSLVPVPANPYAVRQLQALGLPVTTLPPSPQRFESDPWPSPIDHGVHPDLRGFGPMAGELFVPLDVTGRAAPVDVVAASWRTLIAPQFYPTPRAARPGDDEEIVVLADGGDDELIELPIDSTELSALIRESVRGSLANLRRQLEGGR